MKFDQLCAEHSDLLQIHYERKNVFVGKQKYIGKVYKQLISVMDESGQERIFRRIRVALNKKTRNGDTDIYIISNLSKSIANAKKIAELYRDRWTIETAFQYLAQHYNSEIDTGLDTQFIHLSIYLRAFSPAIRPELTAKPKVPPDR